MSRLSSVAIAADAAGGAGSGKLSLPERAPTGRRPLRCGTASVRRNVAALWGALPAGVDRPAERGEPEEPTGRPVLPAGRTRDQASSSAHAGTDGAAGQLVGQAVDGSTSG